MKIDSKPCYSPQIYYNVLDHLSRLFLLVLKDELLLKSVKEVGTVAGFRREGTTSFEVLTS